jgi:hypothetical protein
MVKQVSVPLPLDVAEYFERRAQAEDRSTASAIRVALAEYMRREAGRQPEAA